MKVQDLSSITSKSQFRNLTGPKDSSVSTDDAGLNERLEVEKHNIIQHKQKFVDLATAVLSQHRETPFTSIVSDEVSGRYVALFLRSCLRFQGPLPIVCIDPNVEENLRSADPQVLGSKPLVATEAIFSGRACVRIVQALAELGLEPSVASLSISEYRGFSYNTAHRNLRTAGALNIFVGGHVDFLDQRQLSKRPSLSGMVSKKDKTQGHTEIVPWVQAEHESDELSQKAKSQVLRSNRAQLRSLADDFLSATTASHPRS